MCITSCFLLLGASNVIQNSAYIVKIGKSIVQWSDTCVCGRWVIIGQKQEGYNIQSGEKKHNKRNCRIE
ncbi:hypothetical protein RSOLAG1IB_07816 [Rhizoctonia solani AG-1 IB]|uniref:Uncharacterized protein n=1 Tax=Thanatephorus cucumeris (strain AG1-IB / isolate 7/3/14) TaxID=1108050 RepID=A0A0B7FHJ8_THACB|nr:hypothetical protein RSOLAG1IB_07816 [Rhizoctonia solani AG-1 IB]